MSEARTVTIADFLLARYAEDEAAAREAMAYEGGDEQVAALPEPIFRHVVRNGPARVLADIESKRLILEWHKPSERSCSECSDRDYPEPWPCETVRSLALAYADHPDYRPDFRPEWSPY